jgi:hypothetical protein
MSLGDTSRGGRRHRHSLKPESVNDPPYFRVNAPASRYDQRLGHGARRNQDFVLGFEGGNTGVSLRLIEHNRINAEVSRSLWQPVFFMQPVFFIEEILASCSAQPGFRLGCAGGSRRFEKPPAGFLSDGALTGTSRIAA